MSAEELRQPRRQPAEGRQYGQVQAAALRVGAKAQRGALEMRTRAARISARGLARGAEAHGLAFAHKSSVPRRSSSAHLAADGALREMQLGAAR
ncbi:hypothetical protein J4711_14200 [Staphylococcus epidermidis]|nr:hypothetical protein [Staphylococcus epidermidis]